MRGGIREYQADRITIRYELRRCIHAHECVHGLPRVFDVERRVWVDATQASPDAIAEVVARCPSGALHVRRKDGGAEEPVPDRNEARVQRDGPICLQGRLEIHGATGVLHETRVALCRCGASQNKPFCDNSHRGSGFHDAGSVNASGADPGSCGGALRVLPRVNGPYVIEGTLAISSSDGTSVVRCGPIVSLCRCGRSAHKPFCDGSHAVTGFRSD